MDVTRQSLLLRAQAGNADAWKDLTDLYHPLLVTWLSRQHVPKSDLDDLVQEILLSVFQYLPSFRHSGQHGAFRAWLRTIACNRARDYWRAQKHHPPASGGSDVKAILSQIQDPESELNRQWDQEHDRYVLRCLLDLMEQEFEPGTLQAFRRLALDGASGAEVADELGLSVAAVYVAKSRVLQKIRQHAAGLID
jgi:RNA polymerase sigma-70 factor (ECF subfamily)